MTATPEQIEHYQQMAEEAQRSENRGWRARVDAIVSWAIAWESRPDGWNK